MLCYVETHEGIILFQVTAFCLLNIASKHAVQFYANLQEFCCGPWTWPEAIFL
jgi:hypothetical protein